MSSDAAPAPLPTQDTKGWDVAATIVILCLLALGGLASSFLGLMLVFASDSCGVTSECSTGQIVLGVAVAAIAPWIAILGMGTWSIVRLVRKRTAWWVAMLAIPVWALVFALGVVLTFSAVD